MRKGRVYFNNVICGIIVEDDEGYTFTYDEAYLNGDNQPVSLLLPLRRESYKSTVLFPFFDGLIPEGYLLDLAVKRWGYSYKDRFGLLLKTSNDSIGAVSVLEE